MSDVALAYLERSEASIRRSRRPIVTLCKEPWGIPEIVRLRMFRKSFVLPPPETSDSLSAKLINKLGRIK